MLTLRQLPWLIDYSICRRSRCDTGCRRTLSIPDSSGMKSIALTRPVAQMYLKLISLIICRLVYGIINNQTTNNAGGSEERIWQASRQWRQMETGFTPHGRGTRALENRQPYRTSWENTLRWNPASD